MSAVLPAAARAASLEIVPYVPEPDVTWGAGGIDDWGWTGVALREDSAASSSCPEPS
jgi:hypothetical protein